MIAYTFLWHGQNRPANATKRPGIVASMEKLGRRRKLEVIRVPSHHFPVSKVQQSHQANPNSTKAEQSADEGRRTSQQGFAT